MAKKKKGSEQQDLWTGRIYQIGVHYYLITLGDELFKTSITRCNLFTAEFDLILNALVMPAFTAHASLKNSVEAVIVKTKDANGINHLKKIAKRVYKYKTIKE